MSTARWIGLGLLVMVVFAAIPVLLHAHRMETSPWELLDREPTDPKSRADALATQPPTTGPFGKLVFEGEMSENIAFGTMAFGETGSRVLTLTNAGEGELRLAKGPTSCGCTVSGFGDGSDLSSEVVLQPGEATRLTLTWTPKRPGSFKSSAQILTSDPDRPEVQVRISGEAQAAITTVPSSGAFRFANLAHDETKRFTLTLSSQDRPDFQILSLRSSRPEILEATTRALTAEEPSEDGSTLGFEIDLTLRPSSEPGPFYEELLVTTDHPFKPELRVPVTGARVDAISFTPRHVRISTVPPNGGRGLALLSVRDQEATRFEVAEAPPGVEVVIEPVGTQAVSPIARYRLTASVPPGVPPAQAAGDIVLRTDHPNVGVVRIPVSVVVRDRKESGEASARLSRDRRPALEEPSTGTSMGTHLPWKKGGRES